MRLRKTYTGYSIGCGVVWGVILTLVAVMYPDRLHTFLLVGGGWLIGGFQRRLHGRFIRRPNRSSRRRRVGASSCMGGAVPYERPLGTGVPHRRRALADVQRRAAEILLKGIAHQAESSNVATTRPCRGGDLGGSATV